MFCPLCGRQGPADARFCMICGRTFEQPSGWPDAARPPKSPARGVAYSLGRSLGQWSRRQGRSVAVLGVLVLLAALAVFANRYLPSGAPRQTDAGVSKGGDAQTWILRASNRVRLETEHYVTTATKLELSARYRVGERLRGEVEAVLRQAATLDSRSDPVLIRSLWERIEQTLTADLDARIVFGAELPKDQFRWIGTAAEAFEESLYDLQHALRALEAENQGRR